MNRIEKMSEKIETLDPFSEEHDAFTSTIFGSSVQLGFDGEGRVMLPEHLLKQMGIGEDVTFVGKGHTFEIWEPAAFEKHAEAARKLALEKRQHLRAAP